MKIKYQDVDITDSVTVNACVGDSYYSGHADTLRVEFQDTDSRWDAWAPKVGDRIEAYDENQTTGRLFVRRLHPEVGKLTIYAASIPAEADTKRDQSWEQTSKAILVGDIAKKYGLAANLIYATDRIWKDLKQDNISDFDLLEDLCRLEGDAFNVFNGALTVYNIEKMAAGAEKAKVNVRASADNSTGDNATGAFGYDRGKTYDGCLLRAAGETYSYNAAGSSVYEAMTDYPIGSIGEGISAAKCLMQEKNREAQSGFFYASPLPAGYTAGSIITLATAGASSYNGTALITHMRCDYKNRKAKAFFSSLEE